MLQQLLIKIKSCLLLLLLYFRYTTCYFLFSIYLPLRLLLLLAIGLWPTLITSIHAPATASSWWSSASGPHLWLFRWRHNSAGRIRIICSASSSKSAWSHRMWPIRYGWYMHWLCGWVSKRIFPHLGICHLLHFLCATAGYFGSVLENLSDGQETHSSSTTASCWRDSQQ